MTTKTKKTTNKPAPLPVPAAGTAAPSEAPSPLSPRAIEFSTLFKRDRKRERKGQHRKTVDADLGAVVELLANRMPFEIRHHDHAMVGEWKDHRDCHVKPDLILIYRVTKDDVLQLVRLGSHAELNIA